MANNFDSNDKSDSTAPTSTSEAAEKAKEGSEEVKEDTEETTSTKEDPLTSLAQLSAHIKVRMTECNTKLTSTATSLDNKGDDNSNRLIQDFQKLILTENDKKAQLIELKRTLKNLYSYLTLNGTKEKCEEPSVIRHIETLLTDWSHQLYQERKEQLLERYRTPFKSLMGFLDDQILN